MLQEASQTMNTSSPKKQRISIHKTNLFQPQRLAIEAVAISPSKLFLATLRRYVNQKEINQPLTLIEIYQLCSGSPRFTQRIIEYVDLTSITWTSERHILTTGLDASINVHDIKSGQKIVSTTTDYGPIKCSTFSLFDRLLVTGTDYGFVAVYQVRNKGKCITFQSKMVKINEPITAIDMRLGPRQRPETAAKIEKPSKPIKPGKRKRSASSDESDDDEDDAQNNAQTEEFMCKSDLMICGASKNTAIVWDYHKKSIVETIVVENDVLSILALKNGDIALGDAEGYLGIFDHRSFTCRQSDRILEGGILCLAQNSKSSVVLAAGQEPSIVLMEIDKACEDRDEYKLFEKLKCHNGYVNCALFSSRKEFLICTIDSVIVKFEKSTKSNRKTLNRYTVMPNFIHNISFSDHEMMSIYGKSLQVHRLDGSSVPDVDSQNFPMHLMLEEPQRNCTIRVRSYIHAGALNKDWICHATRKRLSIHDRRNLHQVGYGDGNLSSCQVMEFSSDGQYLMVGQLKKLYIIKLTKNQITNDQQVANEDEQAPSAQYEFVFAFKTKGIVQQITHHKHLNQIHVACGTPRDILYLFDLPCDGINERIKLKSRINLPHSFSFLAYNSFDNLDKNIYIYTNRDQLIGCDMSLEESDKKLIDLFSSQDRIQSLPTDACMLGLVVLSEKHCILYDGNRLFKVDVEANQVVNVNHDYPHIHRMENVVFNQPEEFLIV